MEMCTSLHQGRGKDSASYPAVLMKIKGELFYTNYFMITTVIDVFKLDFGIVIFKSARMSHFL